MAERRGAAVQDQSSRRRYEVHPATKLEKGAVAADLFLLALEWLFRVGPSISIPDLPDHGWTLLSFFSFLHQVSGLVEVLTTVFLCFRAS